MFQDALGKVIDKVSHMVLTSFGHVSRSITNLSQRVPCSYVRPIRVLGPCGSSGALFGKITASSCVVLLAWFASGGGGDSDGGGLQDLSCSSWQRSAIIQPGD